MWFILSGPYPHTQHNAGRQQLGGLFVGKSTVNWLYKSSSSALKVRKTKVPGWLRRGIHRMLLLFVGRYRATECCAARVPDVGIWSRQSTTGGSLKPSANTNVFYAPFHPLERRWDPPWRELCLMAEF